MKKRSIAKLLKNTKVPVYIVRSEEGRIYGAFATIGEALKKVEILKACIKNMYFTIITNISF